MNAVVVKVRGYRITDTNQFWDPDEYTFTFEIPQRPMTNLELRVNGQTLDGNYNDFGLFPDNQFTELTIEPVDQSPGTWVRFEVYTEALDLQVAMTRAYHPLFGTGGNSPPPRRSDLQAAFDGGSLLLGKDHDANDQKIPDDDPMISDPNLADAVGHDDVPLYVRFEIADANPVTFPSCWQWMDGTTNTFTNFQQEKFFDVKFDRDERELAEGGTFANIKQVNSLPVGSGGRSGGLGSRSMVFAQTPSELIAVHEWAHSCVDHRGHPNRNNPDYEDPAAIIYLRANPYTQNKINRYERDLLRCW
jgi:hypothetical protein